METAANADSSGTTNERRVGEQFNPWRGSCGFYAPDVVSRLRGVVILTNRHKLTDLHKSLFIRLVRRAGRDGKCYPSYESLATDIGRCLRQVKTAVGDLEAFGLISWVAVSSQNGLLRGYR
jgi:hypothetical protein